MTDTSLWIACIILLMVIVGIITLWICISEVIDIWKEKR